MMLERRERFPSGAVLAAALLAALCARSLIMSKARPFPVFDEVAYLDLARDYARRGVVGCHLSGECREDNRHPLYSAALSLAVDGTPDDFARGKLLSLAVALSFCGVLFAVSRAAWGADVGAAVLAAAALSPAVALLSQTMCADLAFAGLYFAAAGSLAGKNPSRARWLGAGALSGLAYLAKGNGHVLLLGPLAAAAWRWRAAAWRRPEPWLALAGFAAAASLLLIRNLRVWGEPFHNVNMGYMWLDSWRQSWFVPKDASAAALAADYFSRHAASDAAARALRGAAGCAKALALAAAPGPDSAAWRAAAGCSILALAARGARRRWRDGAAGEVLAFAAPGTLLFAAFSWGAKALGANERFVVPLAASAWPFAAVEIAAFAARRRRPELPRALVPLLATAALAAAAAAIPREDPRRFRTVPPNWSETSRWLREDGSEAGFLIAPESAYSAWDCCPDRRRPFPFDAPRAAIEARMREGGIDRVLLDRFAPAPEVSSEADAHGPLTALGLPRCFHDSERPSVFSVYGRGCARPQ